MVYLIAFLALAALVAVLVMVYRHQQLLKERATLMRYAMHHRDFTFRLPTSGLLWGERALQEALNDTGQDVQKLMARSEVESWQRLTRVLTHEIMNATTPIQSISQAYLQQPGIQGSPYEEGIRAIHDTCLGLSQFVESYRKLTQLQDPVFSDVSLVDFLSRISALYPELQWNIDVPADVMLRADEHLLRQVFINLTKNAIEAGASTMGVRWDGKLWVSNNGRTIPDEVAHEVFVPFFTTKNTGSGIGLSLSRQILMMQKLVLSLSEHPLRGYNVTFVIEKEGSI